MDRVLITEHLVLRPYETGDASAIEALANNWNVARMLGRMPYPYEPGMAAQFMAGHDEARARGTDFPFAVTCADAFIGGSGLHCTEHSGGDGSLELGYWLGEPFWGRGYATEAGRAVIRFGFEALGLNQILAGHFEENPASGHVLEKLGFRYIGQTQRHCLARGCAVRSREMALTRAEWASMDRDLR